MTASITRSTWTPRPRPEWVTHLNLMGANPGSPAAIVALDEPSLLNAAMEATGLDDFGDDAWREGFRILIENLESAAKLNLVGRILARAEIVRSLNARLRISSRTSSTPRSTMR